MEEWREIKGFENYQVSNYGNVRNKTTNRMLKPNKMKNGYLQFRLYDNGKLKGVSIHRLVALHFIDNPNNYNEVNHKDEDKTNNHVSNLEWCSREYNINYGSHNERSSKNRSNKVLVYLKNGQFVGEFESLKECSRQIGYSQGNISNCLNGIRNSKKYNFRLKI